MKSFIKDLTSRLKAEGNEMCNSIMKYFYECFFNYEWKHWKARNMMKSYSWEALDYYLKVSAKLNIITVNY